MLSNQTASLALFLLLHEIRMELLIRFAYNTQASSRISQYQGGSNFRNEMSQSKYVVKPNTNPYAPPDVYVNVGGRLEKRQEPTDIRSQFAHHEASIRVYGWAWMVYGVLGMVCNLLFAGFILYLYLATSFDSVLYMLISIAVSMAICFGIFMIGRGIRKLTDGGKTGGIVLAILNFVGFPVGTALAVHYWWLVNSDMGKYIFSDPYRAIVSATPKYRLPIPWIGWVFVALFAITLISLIVVVLILINSDFELQKVIEAFNELIDGKDLKR